MSKENPESFEDLGVEELRRTAVEDFAVDVKANDNKKTVLAALLECGISWNDYAIRHGLVPTEPVEPVAPTVTETEVKEEVIIHTAEAPKPNVKEKFLVKMERPNLRFDVRGHKFTKEHPYALIDREDLDHILEKEDGFRMATPRELEEFYG